MAAPTPTRRTIRARTGRAAARAPRSWATSTGTAVGSHGIRHIPRAGAVRRIWWRRAAPDCSTALPVIDGLPIQLVSAAGRCIVGRVLIDLPDHEGEGAQEDAGGQ